jgi:hypothetical protein
MMTAIFDFDQMADFAMQTPRVFISYSHDSEAHKARVLELADRLRGDGVDAMLDRYESAPARGWAQWMHDQIVEADFIVVVCTETYNRRLTKHESPGLGLGGVWEGHLLVNLLFLAGAVSNKLIPVLLESDDKVSIPLSFATLQHYLVDSPQGYEDLYRRLTGQPNVVRPPLGTLRRLPARVPQWSGRPESRRLGVPSSPKLFLGRAADMATFKRVLGVLPGEVGAGEPARAASIQGLPGIGKTTFVSALPHDDDILATFPDGVLWIAFGQARRDELRAALLSTLTDWALEWDGDATASLTLPKALAAWRARLAGRRVLLVIDDIWDADAAYLLADVLDSGSSAVITSRKPKVVQDVVPQAVCRFNLGELGPNDSLDLLRGFAPDAVLQRPADCAALLADVGHLPLAIVVAGGLLGGASAPAVGVSKLLEQVRKGTALLRADAPLNMRSLLEDTSVSVAALLGKSVDALENDQQLRFCQLGVCAPKPATIDLSFMAMLWQEPNDKAAGHAAELVDHGVLQVTNDGAFQIHALLAKFAAARLDGM